jgi:hypothetical protein
LPAHERLQIAICIALKTKAHAAKIQIPPVAMMLIRDKISRECTESSRSGGGRGYQVTEIVQNAVDFKFLGSSY